MRAAARHAHGSVGGTAATRFQRPGRQGDARLYRSDSRRDESGLRPDDGLVRRRDQADFAPFRRLAPDLKDPDLEPRELKGARIPSTAEELFAEIHKPRLRTAGSRR